MLAEVTQQSTEDLLRGVELEALLNSAGLAEENANLQAAMCGLVLKERWLERAMPQPADELEEMVRVVRGSENLSEISRMEIANWRLACVAMAWFDSGRIPHDEETAVAIVGWWDALDRMVRRGR